MWAGRRSRRAPVSSTCSRRASAGVEAPPSAPYLPRAFSFARSARTRPAARSSSSSSRTSAPAPAGSPSSRRRRAVLLGPPRARLPTPPPSGRTAGARRWWASAPRRCSAGRTALPARTARAGAWASGPRPHADRPRLFAGRGANRNRRRLGRAPGPRHRSSARPTRRRPHAQPSRLRAPGDACGGASPLRGARRAGQLALESGMACGYGACFGCVEPPSTAMCASASTARFSCGARAGAGDGMSDPRRTSAASRFAGRS